MVSSRTVSGPGAPRVTAVALMIVIACRRSVIEFLSATAASIRAAAQPAVLGVARTPT